MTGAEVLAGAAVLQGIQGYVSGQANAKTLSGNAREVLAQGQEEERRFRVQAMQRAGTGVVNAASQGASLDALDILSSNAQTEELDALTIRYGSKVKANNLRAQASQAKSGAVGSLIGGFVGAGTSLYGTSSLSSGPTFGSQGGLSRFAASGSSSTQGPMQSWGGF